MCRVGGAYPQSGPPLWNLSLCSLQCVARFMRLCTLNASRKTRIFHIGPAGSATNGSAPNVTLENLKLVEGVARPLNLTAPNGAIGTPGTLSEQESNGGCILANQTRLYLNNVVFEDCDAANNGGGLFTVRFGSHVAISPPQHRPFILIEDPLLHLDEPGIRFGSG